MYSYKNHEYYFCVIDEPVLFNFLDKTIILNYILNMFNNFYKDYRARFDKNYFNFRERNSVE